MARTAAVDVVVVGGGAAGCVVAARLAESASRAVLLLEAGPDLRACNTAVPATRQLPASPAMHSPAA
jgi:choline dehydrogenase